MGFNKKAVVVVLLASAIAILIYTIQIQNYGIAPYRYAALIVALTAAYIFLAVHASVAYAHDKTLWNALREEPGYANRVPTWEEIEEGGFGRTQYGSLVFFDISHGANSLRVVLNMKPDAELPLVIMVNDAYSESPLTSPDVRNYCEEVAYKKHERMELDKMIEALEKRGATVSWHGRKSLNIQGDEQV